MPEKLWKINTDTMYAWGRKDNTTTTYINLKDLHLHNRVVEYLNTLGVSFTYKKTYVHPTLRNHVVSYISIIYTDTAQHVLKDVASAIKEGKF